MTICQLEEKQFSQNMLVALVFAFLMSAARSEMKEPQCLSYFDYEQKLIYKLISIEEEVKRFRVFIDELKTNQEKKTREQDDKFETILAKFENDAEKEMNELKVKSDKIVTDLEDKLADVTSAVDDARKVQAVGFSLKNPKASTTSGQLKFTDVTTNTDDAFDLTTGVFTCNTPGFYYFSVSLLKEYNYASHINCHIYKNGINLVQAHAHPGHSSKRGNYPAVNSVYVHLATGDNVTLAGCSAAASLYSGSSFSGFLITPNAM